MRCGAGDSLPRAIHVTPSRSRRPGCASPDRALSIDQVRTHPIRCCPACSCDQRDASAHCAARETKVVLRLVPLVGMTTLRSGGVDDAARRSFGNHAWRPQLASLGGGLLATLVFAVAFAGLVAARERNTGRLWLLGRFIVADAVVITVFNLLPVPPLDGGRAVLAAVVACRGSSYPPI